MVDDAREAPQPDLTEVVHGDRVLLWRALDRSECDACSAEELVPEACAPLFGSAERRAKPMRALFGFGEGGRRIDPLKFSIRAVFQAAKCQYRIDSRAAVLKDVV